MWSDSRFILTDDCLCSFNSLINSEMSSPLTIAKIYQFQNFDFPSLFNGWLEFQNQSIYAMYDRQGLNHPLAPYNFQRTINITLSFCPATNTRRQMHSSVIIATHWRRWSFKYVTTWIELKAMKNGSLRYLSWMSSPWF